MSLSDPYAPYLWLGVTLLVLVLAQRWIHRHLHGLALLATGHANAALIIYAIVLLPGVFLHEFSHWIVAGMLGVRTGRFSLIPRQLDDNSVQLGYVEYYKDSRVGPVRESLIGAAPFFFGVGAILLIGRFVFDLPTLVAQMRTPDVQNVIDVFQDFFGADDAFLWLYLIFAISNAMMPSPSDRRAWPPVIAVGVFLLALIVFLSDAWLTQANPLSVTAGYLALAFGFTLLVDVAFILVIGALEWGIGRIMGQRVRYR